MNTAQKYGRSYFMPPKVTYDWVKKDYIEKAPIWCSVDLRDGNQALVEPMGLNEKLEFFRMLVDIGFKEIEVGFPAASDTEYQFVRALIEKDMIPEDVTIQVLTQAREHIIRKTFEAIRGVPHAIVHLYNSTSVAQREQVFCKSREEIKQLAVEGAAMLKKLAEETEGSFTFEYSPESFPGTEVDYALEICNEVLQVWKPNPAHKAIINIPTTVQIAMPHVFASQVEYIHKNLSFRDSVVLSVHPHNDRGCGISDAEFGILAGADRVEGTLFGNGERTGNVDMITLAMNMFCQGVDPGLNFADIPRIREAYENLTGMKVYERSPYAGDLVFTAFSGSHQDAISKGMTWRKEGKSGTRWVVPYLPIDPGDVGREYESDVIRINSQSGKGGIAFILKQNYGISLPKEMKEEVGYLVKGVSDERHQELAPGEIYHIFQEHYVNVHSRFSIPECHFKQKSGITAEVTLTGNGSRKVLVAQGNGRLDAVSNALKAYFGIDYELTVYEEHAISRGSSAKAVAYVGIMAQGTSLSTGEGGIDRGSAGGRGDTDIRSSVGGRGDTDIRSSVGGRGDPDIRSSVGGRGDTDVRGSVGGRGDTDIRSSVGGRGDTDVRGSSGEAYYWGVGIDEDIIKSSIAALVSAVNKLLIKEETKEKVDGRIVDIMNYIRSHYNEVTLEELADTFCLSKPYLSKYIKNKSGKTFQEAVKEVRLNKAKAMLKESNQTVEYIASCVGYENVEHFNRLFKKTYQMTPIQFRSRGC